MRLKSSSAWAYSMPKTASASVLLYTCAIPQSSRMIVTFCAWRSQRITSERRRWAAAGNVRMQIVRAVLLASRSIDCKGRTWGKGVVHGIEHVYIHVICGDQIQELTIRHPRHIR